MVARINTELKFQVGQDGTLDDCIFSRDFTQLLDTMDHAQSGKYTLAAGEQNVTLDKGDVSAIRVLYLEADRSLDVSLGGTSGAAATLLGAGGAFPTGFAGGELFTAVIDGTTVATTFTVAAQLVQDVVNEINAAAMLAGLGFVPASVEGGQIRINGALVNATGEVEVSVVNATIGFAALTTVNGSDPNGASAPMLVARPASDLNTETVKAYLFATVSTTSVVVSNPDASNPVEVRYAIVGDLVT